MFEFVIEVLIYELNFWENRNKFKVAKDHIKELQQAITLLENISKDRIVEVLNKHFSSSQAEQIADEILGVK